MLSYFNGKEVTIKEVDNGFVVTGDWNYVPHELIAPTFADVIELLWRSYCDPSVGEECPYTRQRNTPAPARGEETQ